MPVAENEKPYFLKYSGKDASKEQAAPAKLRVEYNNREYWIPFGGTSEQTFPKHVAVKLVAKCRQGTHGGVLTAIPASASKAEDDAPEAEEAEGAEAGEAGGKKKKKKG